MLFLLFDSGSVCNASNFPTLGHGIGKLSNTHPSGRRQSATAYGVHTTAFLKRSMDMRIPTDKSLSQYIKELIQANTMYKFYKTDEWIELKDEVLEECHHECQECIKHGRYTKADCVHHVNEVRVVPSLALSKYYIDSNGKKQRNLLPLCNQCHNKVHDKLGQWQRKDKFTNDERW